MLLAWSVERVLRAVGTKLLQGRGRSTVPSVSDGPTGVVRLTAQYYAVQANGTSNEPLDGICLDSWWCRVFGQSGLVRRRCESLPVRKQEIGGPGIAAGNKLLPAGSGRKYLCTMRVLHEYLAIQSAH